MVKGDANGSPGTDTLSSHGTPSKNGSGKKPLRGGLRSLRKGKGKKALLGGLRSIRKGKKQVSLLRYFRNDKKESEEANNSQPPPSSNSVSDVDSDRSRSPVLNSFSKVKSLNTSSSTLHSPTDDSNTSLTGKDEELSPIFKRKSSTASPAEANRAGDESASPSAPQSTVTMVVQKPSSTVSVRSLSKPLFVGAPSPEPKEEETPNEVDPDESSSESPLGGMSINTLINKTSLALAKRTLASPDLYGSLDEKLCSMIKRKSSTESPADANRAGGKSASPSAPQSAVTVVVEIPSRTESVRSRSKPLFVGAPSPEPTEEETPNESDPDESSSESPLGGMSMKTLINKTSLVKWKSSTRSMRPHLKPLYISAPSPEPKEEETPNEVDPDESSSESLLGGMSMKTLINRTSPVKRTLASSDPDDSLDEELSTIFKRKSSTTSMCSHSNPLFVGAPSPEPKEEETPNEVDPDESSSESPLGGISMKTLIKKASLVKWKSSTRSMRSRSKPLYISAPSPEPKEEETPIEVDPDESSLESPLGGMSIKTLINKTSLAKKTLASLDLDDSQDSSLFRMKVVTCPRLVASSNEENGPESKRLHISGQGSPAEESYRKPDFDTIAKFLDMWAMVYPFVDKMNCLDVYMANGWDAKETMQELGRLSKERQEIVHAQKVKEEIQRRKKGKLNKQKSTEEMESILTNAIKVKVEPEG